MESIQSVNEIVNVLLRRIPFWGPIVAIGVVVSVIYALSLPRLYETTAVIQVGNSQISDQINANSRAPSVAQYLNKIEQRIMARDNLLEVIRQYDLFNHDPMMSDGDKVFQLRTATRIEQIVDPGQAWRPDAVPSALTVTVRLGEPELVAKVTNDFVERVLDQNRLARLEQVGRRLAFFDGEQQRVGAAIAALDDEIAGFKQENANSLPEALPAQHEMLVSLEDAILTMDQQMVELNNNKAKLRKDDFEQQMALAQEQLALISARRDAVRRAIDAAPQVEKTFNALQRQLSQLENQYAVIARNRAEAEIGQMLETGSQSEQLSVLEKALVPDRPVSPNRKKIVVVGSALAVIVAAVVVLILELLNPVIRTAAQLERQLQINPVVTIPVVKTTGDRIIHRAILAVAALLGSLGILQFLQYIGRNTG